MKNFTFIALFLFSAITSVFGQIRWEPGYFIDNNGARFEGLILNKDWNDSPDQFNFKNSESDSERTITMLDAQEFSVLNELKYVRATVDIERSSSNMDHYQFEKQPNFNQETVYLKTLVQGLKSLYTYKQSGLTKFFYKSGNEPIKQLVYIRYRHYNNIEQSYDKYTKENNQFRNQLWNEVKCDQTELKKIERIAYKRNDLVKYFTEINTCLGDTSEEVFIAPRQKGDFNLRIEAGYSFYNHTINREPARFASDIDDSGANFGLEAEYILPVYKGKWAIIFGVNYNTFKGEEDFETISIVSQGVDVEHNFVQIPVGIRHYMFLNDKSKLFVSGVMGINLIHDASVKYRTERPIVPDPSVYNFGLGLGFDYGRFSAEARFFSSMGIISSIDSGFSKKGIIVRYKIF